MSASKPLGVIEEQRPKRSHISKIFYLVHFLGVSEIQTQIGNKYSTSYLTLKSTVDK